ncbi:MAG: hypothetical protein H6732_19385 [Alphaproteobacteria bacterium]|nr:hypothetical protein [Alphaproteobacteria bacterium]
MVLRVASWVLVAGCVTGFETAALLGDRDADGRPDTADACPDDPDDDADGDGVCGDVDACPGHPDDEDADGDGLPDGCDACPDDAEGDRDGDGLCASDDLCPDEEGTGCDVQLILGIQVDFFYEEATWELSDYRGSLEDSGGFAGPGAGFFRRITVPGDKSTCVRVDDRDGGSRGVIFNRRLGQRYAGWSFEDSRKRATVCFTPDEDGEPFEAPLEEDWLRDGACKVDLLIDVGNAPQEVAWGLRDPEDKLIQGVTFGTYAAAGGEERYSYTLAEGRYTLELFDEGGDGWTGGGWKLGKPGASGPFGEGTLAGAEETVTVQIRCGANP